MADLTSGMWAARDYLRNRKLLPDLSHIGVPLVMTNPVLYMALIIGLPVMTTLVLAWAVAGFLWALLFTAIMFFVSYLFNFFVMMN